jgi:hypothetical protein
MATYVAVFALVLAGLSLVAAFCALRTLSRLRRATAVLGRDGPARETVVAATERHITATRAVADQLTTLRAGSARALRHVALVRFDAFDDLAGRMSFALALLDEHGDGVTLSSIAGRHDTRLYAKGVMAGAGQDELSPEERRAVAAALRPEPARREAGPARSRRRRLRLADHDLAGRRHHEEGRRPVVPGRAVDLEPPGIQFARPKRQSGRQAEHDLHPGLQFLRRRHPGK